MSLKLRMIPQTVPNRPTNGATEPTVARMLSRPARRSTSAVTALCSAADRRERVPSLSTVRPAVERRHSASPAASTLAEGRSSPPRVSWKRSMSSAFQKSFSNACEPREARLSFIAWPTMIAQVHRLASSKPTITAFTTTSA